MASMQEMRQKIMNLTGKYDKLVQDVKGLKTKIKKDESTINSLQKEVNQLKSQRGASNGGGANINKMQKVVSAPTQTQTQPASNNAMDPLDMFFGGGNNTTSNGGAQPQNNGNTQTNGGGGGGNDFAGWTSFN